MPQFLQEKAAQLQQAFEDRVVSQMREAEATAKVSPKTFEKRGLLPESQGQNLDLTV